MRRATGGPVRLIEGETVMHLRLSRRLRIAAAGTLALTAIVGMALAPSLNRPARAAAAPHMHLTCEDNSYLCTEALDSLNYDGQYTGHDEPSVLFYSDKAGAGNSNLYQLTLPKDPPTLPAQDGTGGTFNFQLHPAFWFGMAMCDTQSAPNPGNVTTCTPDSDANIFDDANPSSPRFIGQHPGTAFMEMQFYPPSWAPWPDGNSCDAHQWCAALNIDSLTQNLVTGQNNNADCIQNVTGPEPVNFAFITTSGTAHAPANPVESTLDTFTPNRATDMFMNSGDTLSVDMHDTAAGFQVVIHDLTSGATGSMTASVANQFGQVKWDPTGTTCTNIPAAFHPMYATSSEHTRVPWAAHSYNVAFSDEIGHFEYCNAVNPANRRCTADGVHDLDATLSGAEDDRGCFTGAQSTLVNLTGCTRTDADFDGPEYANTWPGTFSNAALDQQVHSTPIRFTSPLFRAAETGDSANQADQGELRNFDRVAFEADLPRIENDTKPPCQRHVLFPSDPNPGAGCVNPPANASFYPFFTTAGHGDACVWQEGGAFIPGTTNTFGGSSATEFGGLLRLVYPDSNPNQITVRFNNFRQVLDHNPCHANDQGAGN